MTEREGKGWEGEEAESAPKAKARLHQNYFPGAGAALEAKIMATSMIKHALEANYSS